MQNIILVINAGSSSIKFAIFITSTNQQASCLFQGQVAGIGNAEQAKFEVNDKAGQTVLQKRQPVVDHQHALDIILNWLNEDHADFQLVAAGHRVVHGGGKYARPVIVDETVIADLQDLIPLAPLHQPHNLNAILALQQLQPQLIQVACFDTAFHQTIPEVAHTFALPKTLYQEGIRSYGFHGLSYDYITSVLPRYSDQGLEPTGKIIIAHLGQGASLCAVDHGHSVATTMSFTPLDGLPMGTRCGAIDPAVILYLLREKNLSAHEISDLLHYQSGLAGVSGISSDMRTLLDSPSSDAQKAVAIFVYHCCCEIGFLAAALGGLDALVFTAGIGEHSAAIREKICQGSAWLGCKLDFDANQTHASKISTEDSPSSIWVIPTDEQQIIADHTINLAFS